jgi:hypothetical protein
MVLLKKQSGNLALMMYYMQTSEPLKHFIFCCLSLYREL